MPGRGTLELGTWYTCRAHGLRVRLGAGVAPLEHTGGASLVSGSHLAWRITSPWSSATTRRVRWSSIIPVCA